MSAPATAAAAIQERAPGFTPRVGLVLGSGLGALVDELADASRSPTPTSPASASARSPATPARSRSARSTASRSPASRAARTSTRGSSASAVTTPVRTLRLLGAEILVLTNAAGSLRPEAGPGSLVALTDHINMQGFNPLMGLNDEEVGPRFPSLSDAYDPELRAGLHAAADELGTTLHDGVYLAVTGPSFETPAEIRAFRTLGADLVGMSTVPEAIVARHCGLRVAAVSVVTNLAEGMGEVALSHEQTLEEGKRGAASLGPLLRRWVGKQ